MPSDVRTRVAVLVALAILGVMAAGIGATLGATAPLADDRSDTQFVVSEQNVTVSGQGQHAEIVDDMSNVTAVEISETDPGHFTIDTQRDRPLSETDRERAKAIARTNDTVRRSLEDLDDVTLTVDPIHAVTVNSGQRIDGNVTLVDGDENVSVVTFDQASVGNRSDSVVVHRDPAYVEDEAVVRVRQPSENAEPDLKYSIDVDLASGTVTGITDWDEIRSESIDVETTATTNATLESGTLSCEEDC